MPVNVKDASGATVAAVTLDDVIGAGKSLGTVILGVGSAIIGKVGIDQTTPGTTDSVSVKGQGVGAASGTVTRPGNTTAYAVGDVVGATAAAITLTGFSAGEWLITGVDFWRGSSALESGEGSYSLALYSVTPPSALADNALWDLPSGDRTAFLGKLDIGTPVKLGNPGGTIRVDTSQNKQITLTGASLFVYLITNAAYTPQSASTLFVTVHATKL